MAELAADIESFENDSDKEIVNGGDKLSGGQKLRLSLARMFYGDCNLYIIDDMSSSIDRKTFEKIWDNIVKKKRAGYVYYRDR